MLQLPILERNQCQCTTKVVNKIKHIIRCHNLRWDMPTKTFPSQAAIAWLRKLALPKVDRLEMDYLLSDLEHVQRRMDELEEVIAERCA